MSGTYEHIDHTADVIIRARADSLREAVATAARALFDVITGEAVVESVETYTVKVDSDDLEALVVAFLSELIVLHETENVVLGDFSVDIDIEKFTIHAQCRGETFDPDRHGQGMHVKAVSYHMIEVFDGKGEKDSRVQVLFDV